MVEESRSEPFLVLLALLGALVHFIPIWMNLNKTLWHYSCMYHRYNVFWSLKVENLKSEPLLVLLLLFSISFQFGPIWTNLCGITHVASKWYILIIKGRRNKIWAFFSPLGASWRYIPFHSNLDESERNFVALLM